MSRLQVGGLALIVGHTICDRNLGKTVKLDAYKGYLNFDDGSTIDDLWQVSSDDLVWKNGEKQDYCFVQSKNLLPLGDKKTQDELKNEVKNHLDRCMETSK